jgi:hypothetical protein
VRAVAFSLLGAGTLLIAGGVAQRALTPEPAPASAGTAGLAAKHSVQRSAAPCPPGMLADHGVCLPVPEMASQQATAADSQWVPKLPALPAEPERYRLPVPGEAQVVTWAQIRRRWPKLSPKGMAPFGTALLIEVGAERQVSPPELRNGLRRTPHVLTGDGWSLRAYRNAVKDSDSTPNDRYTLCLVSGLEVTEQGDAAQTLGRAGRALAVSFFQLLPGAQLDDLASLIRPETAIAVDPRNLLRQQ